MYDFLLAQTALSADAKYIIGMMATAIVAMFVFLKIVLGKVFTLFSDLLGKNIESFKEEMNRMHGEGIKELKEIKKTQNSMNTKLTLTETHSKEAKHAVQNLPCTPKKDKQDPRSEEQY